MPSLAELTNASGFALFAFETFVAALGLARQWVVPGWIYQQAIARAEKAEAESAAQRIELQAQRETILALTAGLKPRDARRGPDARP